MTGRLEVVPEEDAFYVSVGEVVAGKFLVERVLGAGGMAFVVAARHLSLDETFALKFLSPHLLLQPTIAERFTREAKAACRIKSDHVARVFDVGVHEGAPFLVMEHLVGRDLSSVVAEGGPLPVEQAVDYVLQACEALAAVHADGIVHRDVKPENLFVVEHDGLPRIKLLDFGISKVHLGGDGAPRLTTELAMGTPCYMAPEQIRSMTSADARSDLWSLGAVLYELLAGTEAFQGETVTELCAAVLEQDPTPLRELNTDVPRELEGVVARCLEKEPARRFADVADLAEALLPFAPFRAAASVERTACILHGAPRSSSASIPPRRSARGVLAGAALALAGVAVLGLGASLLRRPVEVRGLVTAPSPVLAAANAALDVPSAEATEAGAQREVGVAVVTSVSKRPARPPAKPPTTPTTTSRPRRAAARGPSPSAPNPPERAAAPSSSSSPSPAPARASDTAPVVELGY